MSVSLLLAGVVTAFLALRDSPARAEPEPLAETTPEPTTATKPREEAISPEQRPEEPRPEAADAPAPLMGEGWEAPSGEEISTADGPRRYAPAQGAALTLSIPALQVYDAPVFDSDSPDALNRGIAHVPETSMPWDGGAQRNVYLAAHRIGYAGTGSRLVFYHLDRLKEGDAVVLKGRGETYRYRVSEVMVVDPTDSWVMGQVQNRDMVSLQTCTPIPTFEKRLVVRAARI